MSRPSNAPTWPTHRAKARRRHRKKAATSEIRKTK